MLKTIGVAACALSAHATVIESEWSSDNYDNGYGVDSYSRHGNGYGHNNSGCRRAADLCIDLHAEPDAADYTAIN